MLFPVLESNTSGLEVPTIVPTSLAFFQVELSKSKLPRKDQVIDLPHP